jgi:hypothetical protein
MGERATKLIAIGQQLQVHARARLCVWLDARTHSPRAWQEEMRLKSGGRKVRQTFNRFKQNVYLLDEDWSRLYSAHVNRGARILWAYIRLVGGCFAVLLSLLWFVHITIFMLPRVPGHVADKAVIFDLLGSFFHWFDRVCARAAM